MVTALDEVTLRAVYFIKQKGFREVRSHSGRSFCKVTKVQEFFYCSGAEAQTRGPGAITVYRTD